MEQIEGQRCAHQVSMNAGNGFATYAFVGGQWYSANVTPDGIVADVRWTATPAEREAIHLKLSPKVLLPIDLVIKHQKEANQ